jgi:hypothetical protein
MPCLITDKDERAWYDDKNQFDDYSDNNYRRAFFLTYHQMVAYHQGLSFCLQEAALCRNFEVSKPVCLALIIMNKSHK